MTKQQTNPAPDFHPGSSYQRDGVVMVEIAPGQFVREDVAQTKGVTPLRQTERA